MGIRRRGDRRRDGEPLRVLPGRASTPAVRFARRPRLERPVLVTAFDGWNDAGEAASYAASYLASSWEAVPFAEIDPEEFFDFTEVRPEIALDEANNRKITWPATTFSVAAARSGRNDVVIVRGPEPQLRWRTYCESVVEIAKTLHVERVVTLGAYLAEVTHNRPVPLSAAASDSRLFAREGLAPSLYEGPTGIVGVLGAALSDAGVPTVSLWASVPCYSLPVSAKAALALVKATTRAIGSAVDTAELEAESVEYERRMDELISEDENVAAYVARIEEMEEVVGAELSAEGLAEEIERYLRNNRPG